MCEVISLRRYAAKTRGIFPTSEVLLGGSTRNELVELINETAFSPGFELPAHEVTDLVNDPNFRTSPELATCRIIVLTPDDLGFKKMPNTNQLFGMMKLSWWAVRNKSKIGNLDVRIPPDETGLHLWADQPPYLRNLGDHLWVPVGDVLCVSASRNTVILARRFFKIERTLLGLRIEVKYVSSAGEWNLYTPIAFCLQGRIQRIPS